MTLQRSDAQVDYVAEPAPVGPLEAVKAWCERQFRHIEYMLQGPRVLVIRFERIDSLADPAIAKPEAGMMVYAGPGVFGPQEGLWAFNRAGVWVKA